MKKKIGLIFLIALSITLCSCFGGKHQEDWHINTLELADEYFPKYFEFIEKELINNDIQYEKIYSENYKSYDDYDSKSYDAEYYLSKNMYFKFNYTYDGREPIFCRFYADFSYYLDNEDAILNLPQKYIDIMINIVNFCSVNYSGTGEKYNTLYDVAKEKYRKGKVIGQDPFYSYIYEKEENPSAYWRGVYLSFNEKYYGVAIGIFDFLIDTNIWDK